MLQLTSYKRAGFTLIEVLIALFIFSILGTIGAISIRSVIHTYQRTKQLNNELEKIEIATTIMRFDFSQMIQRSIVNEDGGILPPLIITSTHSLEFTTAGYSNPFALERRGTLRRVAYEWDNEKLIRITWSALDRPPHIMPERRVLLSHVTQMALAYVNQQGQLVDAWVADNTAKSNAPITLPRAIVVTLTLSHFGTWQGVFPIVGRGYDAS